MIHRMRKTFLLCTAVFVAVLTSTAALSAQTAAAPSGQTFAAPAAPAENWQTYSYPADGFSASFPGTPTEQKQNVPTVAGTFELRAYLVETGQSAVFVGVCDYGNAVAGRDPDSVLQGAENGAISNVSAHLVSSSKITLGVYHGMQFEAENTSMHFSARIYLVGTTLYQTLTASPLSAPYAGVTRFLDSFELIARVQNQSAQ